jgi:ABC-type amino acid transport substrate-binding protein
MLLLAACLAASLAPVAMARADTLDTLKQRKTILLGVRSDQPPFSQIDKDGKPVGYMVALCQEIVQGLRDTQSLPDLAIKYVTVSADSRFDDLASGKIDMLCEGTGQTIQRMQKFDFTIQTWVSGTGLMTRSDETVGSIKDLEGRRVGVVGNTTTESMLRATLQRLLITSEIITFESHNSAIRALFDKKIDAYFADRDTLMTLRNQSKEPNDVKVAEETLSVEPAAFALRQHDDRLRLTADLVLSRLYRSGKIQEIFRTYFPNAEPSALLKALFILQALPEI